MEWDEALSRCNAEVPQRHREPGIYIERPQINRIIVPPAQWQSRARSFVEWASTEVEKKLDVMEWLENRGLSIAVVKRYKIGYSDNPRSTYGSFQFRLSNCGFPEEDSSDGKPKTMWIPRGIVIPTIEPSGAVIRVKIRRSDWKPRDKIPKYIALKGCMGGMNLVGDKGMRVMVVVESELDAYALHDKVKDFALVVAIGSNIKHPDLCTDYLAKNAQFLLICHDNDIGGRAMLEKWEGLYPHAIAHPTDEGKDIGEFVQLGGGLRKWLLSGLSAEFGERLNITSTLPNEKR